VIRAGGCAATYRYVARWVNGLGLVPTELGDEVMRWLVVLMEDAEGRTGGSDDAVIVC